MEILSDRGVLPEGFAALAPGAELLELVTSVDLDRLPGEEFEALMAGVARLVAHTQAVLLTVIRAATRRVLGPPGVIDPPPVTPARHADQVVGWALHLPPEQARKQCALAETVVEELPAVLAALADGRVDLPKAEAFADGLALLADRDKARQIADEVLVDAPTLTLERVRDRLRYKVDRVDTVGSRRRYRAGVAARGVSVRANRDGTATVTLSKIPKPRAVACFDRSDRLARAARAQGDPRTLPQSRADSSCDLLEGRPFQVVPSVDPDTGLPPDDGDGAPPPGGWSRVEPVDLTPYETGELSGFQTWVTEPDPVEPDPVEPGPVEPVLGESGDGSGFQTRVNDDDPDDPYGSVARLPDDPGPRPDDSSGFATRVTEPDPAADSEAQPEPTQPDSAERDSAERALDVSGDGCGFQTRDTKEAAQSKEEVARNAEEVAWAAEEVAWDAEVLAGDRCRVCGGIVPRQRMGAVEVDVKLTTLAGADDDPGLMPGLGTVLAEVARQVAFDPVGRSVWAWSLRADNGRLLHHGTTARRPGLATRKPPPPPTASTPTASTSTASTSSPVAPLCRCERVVPAVKRSVVDLQLTASTLASPPPGWERVVADIAAQVAADDPPSKWTQRNPDGTLQHHGFTMRFFPQQEAAFIRARDRTCRTPNCHRPSGRCELDHREEHAKGGPSHRGCGEPRCTLHHVTRHLPGVSVTRDANGTVTYHLPNGNTHEVPEDNDIILTRDEQG